MRPRSAAAPEPQQQQQDGAEGLATLDYAPTGSGPGPALRHAAMRRRLREHKR